MKRIALLALLLQVGFVNCGDPEEPMAAALQDPADCGDPEEPISADMQGPANVTLPSGWEGPADVTLPSRDAIKAFYANSCETLSPTAQKILEEMTGVKVSFAAANRLKRLIFDFHHAEKPLEVNAELFDPESVAARKKLHAELSDLVAPISFDEEVSEEESVAFDEEESVA